MEQPQQSLGDLDQNSVQDMVRILNQKLIINRISSNLWDYQIYRNLLLKPSNTKKSLHTAQPKAC